jgi:hydrogenase nickel incorporation protein HypA/HybF
MHEFYITSQIFNIAVDAAIEQNARMIKSIRVVVGELTGVSDECMLFYFDLLRPGTIASDALLEITIAKAILQCSSCNCEFSRTPDFACPQCGAKGTCCWWPGIEGRSH